MSMSQSEASSRASIDSLRERVEPRGLPMCLLRGGKLWSEYVRELVAGLDYEAGAGVVEVADQLLAAEEAGVFRVGFQGLRWGDDAVDSAVYPCVVSISIEPRTAANSATFVIVTRSLEGQVRARFLAHLARGAPELPVVLRDEP